MGFSYETGGDLSTGGKFLQDPGTYHLLITEMDERPSRKDGSPIDNAAFRVNLAVLAGTVDGQKDKVQDLVFFYPKPSDKKEGAFAKKKFDRFFVSTGLLTEEEAGQPGNKVDVNLQDAVSRQFVAKFQKTDDEKYLELSYTDMWHVDDPAVKDIPKDQDALSLLPASQRMIGSKKNEKPKKQQATPKRKAEPAVDYSDL